LKIPLQEKKSCPHSAIAAGQIFEQIFSEH